MFMTNPRARFWLLAFAAFFLMVWALKPMLLPFVAGLTLAYFLNPVVNMTTNTLRLPRWLGTLVTLAGFALIVTTILLLIVPLLQTQITTLIAALPETVDHLRKSFLPWAQHLLTQLPADEVERIREASSDYASSVVGWSGQVLKSVVRGGVALFDILTLAVITPVVAFYLLRDWPVLTQTIDDLLPRRQYATIRQQLEIIDTTLSGFIRGQALVCICLGLIYGGGLTLVGLKYGATIGIIAGLLSFIPYAGSTFVLVSSLLLAFVQFDHMTPILMTLLVFVVGQSLEGYVLTPKLVGDRVGLHPVWILFALFAGASLIGFLGVLIAVPVAAVIGVLTRFMIARYRKSSLYAPAAERTTQAPTH